MWESYSNGKDANGVNLDTAGDPSFNQRVLMFLQGEAVPAGSAIPNGYPAAYVNPTGNNDGVVGLGGIDANLFNDGRNDQSITYIFTPVWPNDPDDEDDNDEPSLEDLKYPNRYGMGADGKGGEVAKTISNIIATRSPRVVVVPYMPLNTGDEVQRNQLSKNRLGYALFQYDPNSDGNGQKAWRLFLEGRIDYRKLQ